MEGIEFETEKYKPLQQAQTSPKKSWAIRVVMKLSGGRIKTDEQASYVLIAIAVVFIILSIYNFSSSSKRNTPSKEEILRVQNQMELQLNDTR